MSIEVRKFDQWAIVEIMGHQNYAGRVTEETIGGASFVRVDVPQCGEIAPFTKLFGGSSIYCITPVTEEVARLRAERLQKAPLDVWDLPESVRKAMSTPKVTGPTTGPTYDEEGDPGEFEDDEL